MTYKRSRLEIYLDVLEVIRRGTNKPTRIMYRSNISWRPLKEIFSFLLDKGLIEVKNAKGHKRY